MNTLLFVAILPVVLLLMFVYKKDTKKEPMNVVMKIFFLGCASCVPTVICEMLLDGFFSTSEFSSYLQLFINVFIGVAIVEEFFKWLIIKRRIYDHEHYDETYDSIVYAVFASLGFAALENLLYVIGGGLVTALLRAVTSIPGHACFGIVMGYFFSKAKLASHESAASEKKYLILGLVLPALIHTIYDFLIFTSNMTFIIMWVVYIIALFIFCFVLVSKAAKNNYYFHGKAPQPAPSVTPTFNTPQMNNSFVTTPQINTNTEQTQTQNPLYTETNSGIKFCPKCGNRVDGGLFCSKCGNKLE